jgi:hypothetical protein
VADQASETAAAATPIMAEVVAAGMAGTTVIQVVRLRLDLARWVTTSVAGAARRGTGCVTAGPNQRGKRRTLQKKKSP